MNDGELASRLHELVRAVDVERLSPAGVQRRVRERARRRHLRRALVSAALATAAVVGFVGAWAAGDHGLTNRVVTTGPIVPAAPQTSLPAEPSGPASQPATTSGPDTAGHDGARRDAPTTRGGSEDSGRGG